MENIDGLDSVYDSDEFRMYVHKVLPCSKRSPHDWSQCPFSHPGEKAKRRNIRTHSYDCEICPEVAKGQECKLGSTCPHSHNVFEAWLHPQRYRTMLCKDKDKCNRSVCFFAHGPHQLRTPVLGTSSAAMQLNDGYQQGTSMEATTAAAGSADYGLQRAAREASPAAKDTSKQWHALQVGLLSRAASCGSGTYANPAVMYCASPPAAGSVVAPLRVATSPAASGRTVESATAVMHFGSDGDVRFCGSSAGMIANGGGLLLPQQLMMTETLLEGAEMSGMQQLLSTLAYEINSSRQAAQQSKSAAGPAHEQWQGVPALHNSHQQMVMLSSAATPSNTSAYWITTGAAPHAPQVADAGLSPAHTAAGNLSSQFVLPSSTASLLPAAAAAATHMPSDCSSATSTSLLEPLASAFPSLHGSSVPDLPMMALMPGVQASHTTPCTTSAYGGIPPPLQYWQLNGTSCVQAATWDAVLAAGETGWLPSMVPQVGSSEETPSLGIHAPGVPAGCSGTAPADWQAAAISQRALQVTLAGSVAGRDLTAGLVQDAHLATLNAAAEQDGSILATATGMEIHANPVLGWFLRQ